MYDFKLYKIQKETWGEFIFEVIRHEDKKALNMYDLKIYNINERKNGPVVIENNVRNVRKR